MTISPTITVTTPGHLRRLLVRELDQLGFDYFADCIQAIIQHSDYADRWDVRNWITPEQLAELDKFRAEVIQANPGFPVLV